MDSDNMVTASYMLDWLGEMHKEDFSMKLINRIREVALSSEFDLLELLNLDERQFSSVFGKLNWSIDVVTFKRNVILALGNIADKSVATKLKRYAISKSKILRSSANWALKKLNLD